MRPAPWWQERSIGLAWPGLAAANDGRSEGRPQARTAAGKDEFMTATTITDVRLPHTDSAESVDVTVSGGTIRSVQPSDRFRPKGTVVRGEGRTLLPGLIDTHVHLRGVEDVHRSPLRRDGGRGGRAAADRSGSRRRRAASRSATRRRRPHRAPVHATDSAGCVGRRSPGLLTRDVLSGRIHVVRIAGRGGQAGRGCAVRAFAGGPWGAGVDARAASRVCCGCPGVLAIWWVADWREPFRVVAVG